MRYLAPMLSTKLPTFSGFSLSVTTLRLLAAFFSPPLKSCVKPTAKFICSLSSETTSIGETAKVLNSKALSSLLLIKK